MSVRPKGYPYHTLIETYRSWGKDPGLEACLSGRRPGGFAHFIRVVLNLKKAQVYELLGGLGDKDLSIARKALEEARAAGLVLGQAQALFSLSGFYGGRGDYEHMRQAAQEALELFTLYGQREMQAHALNNLGYVCSDGLGDIETAITYFERALLLFEATEDRTGMALGFSNLATLHGRKGDYDRAHKEAEQALRLAEEIGNLYQQGYCLETIAYIYSQMGDLARALAHNERALALHEAVGDRYGQAWALSNIGALQASLGQFDHALVAFARCHELSLALDDRTGIGLVLSKLGVACEALGDHSQAAERLVKAVAVQSETGEQRNLTLSLLSLVSVRLAQADLARAREALSEAQAVYREGAPDNEVLFRLAHATAALALEDGDLKMAHQELESSLLLAEALGSKCLRATALVLRAQLKDRENDWPGSQADWVESVNLFGSLGDKAELARASYYFGKALLAHGEDEKGRWYLVEARRIWEAIGAKGWMGRMDLEGL